MVVGLATVVIGGRGVVLMDPKDIKILLQHILAIQDKDPTAYLVNETSKWI